MVHETQKERGTTAGFIGSKGAKFGPELTKQRQATDTRITEFKTLLSETNRSGLPDEFNQTLDDAAKHLDSLASTRQAVSAQNIALGKALGYYTKMNGDFLNAIADMAHLSSDPTIGVELGAYGSFLKSKERMGIERAVLTNTFAGDKFGPGMYAKFITLLAEQNSYMDGFVHAGSKTGVAAYKAAQNDPAFAAVEEMREIAKSKSNTGGFEVDAGHWFATITKKINAVKSVEDELANELITLASTRAAAANMSVYISLGVILVVITGLATAATWIVHSIAKGFSRFIKAISDIEENNDLTLRIDIASKDELGVLSKHFNSLIETLQNIIIEVRETSGQVATAANEVAATSQELSGGINEQSDRVYQMSAAIEEMSSSVQMVADQAQKASQDAQQAGDVARSGEDTVKQTVAGMQGIDEAVSFQRRIRRRTRPTRRTDRRRHRHDQRDRRANQPLGPQRRDRGRPRRRTRPRLLGGSRRGPQARRPHHAGHRRNR